MQNGTIESDFGKDKHGAGAGYPIRIHSALREAVADARDRQKPITAATLRRMLRAELQASRPQEP